MKEEVYNITVPWNNITNDSMDPLLYTQAYVEKLSPTSILTVPIMYSYQRILSAKTLTFNAAPIGAFDDLKIISNGIWIGLGCVIILLVAVDILHMLVMETRKSLVAVASQKVILYFGAILGKGFDIPSSLAIRFSVGFFLLIIVIFVNLFSGVLKANYSSQKKENINNLEDLLKVSGVHIDNTPLIEGYVHQLTEDERRIFLHLKSDGKTFDSKNLPRGKAVWFADIFNLQMIMANYQYQKTKDMPNQSDLELHISSAKYMLQPNVLRTYPKMNPKVRKYINRRLRAFLETGQITVWHRSAERYLSIKMEPEHPTTETVVQKIQFENIGAKVALWAAMLGVASFAFTIELLTMI